MKLKQWAFYFLSWLSCPCQRAWSYTTSCRYNYAYGLAWHFSFEINITGQGDLTNPVKAGYHHIREEGQMWKGKGEWKLLKETLLGTTKLAGL